MPGNLQLNSAAGGRDRPIEVTLQRAWHALSWAQRLNLAWSLVTSRPQASDLELLKESASEEAMADVLQSLSTQYPQVSFATVPLQNRFAAPGCYWWAFDAIACKVVDSFHVWDDVMAWLACCWPDFHVAPPASKPD